MGGEVGGRVLQGGDGVLRQPRLREDGVVGGEHGGEECRQDEEEVEKRGSSIRSIDLGDDKIITCIIVAIIAINSGQLIVSRLCVFA